MKIHRKKITKEDIQQKARDLGADLVGIADGKSIDVSHITDLDAGRVIVLAKRLNEGVARINRWNDRHKYYNDELALTHLDPTDDIHATAAYRAQLVRVLTRRVLQAAYDDARSRS